MNSTILVLSVVCLVNLANLNALDWVGYNNDFYVLKKNDLCA